MSWIDVVRGDGESLAQSKQVTANPAEVELLVHFCLRACFRPTARGFSVGLGGSPLARGAFWRLASIV